MVVCAVAGASVAQATSNDIIFFMVIQSVM